MPRKTINWGTDEDFIKNYELLKSSRKMGELYNCDKSSVLNHAKKIGFDPNCLIEKKITEKDKQEILNSYETKTSTELADYYGVSKSLITQLWTKAGLRGKTKNNGNNANNLIGKTFGYLTVIEKTDKRAANGGIYWKCKCECNRPNCLKEKIIMGQSLKNGTTISCGAVGKEKLKIGQGANFIDLSEQKFGKLLVIKRTENKILSNGESEVQYECICECGRKTKVLASNLRNGNTQSCGLCSENSHGNIKIEEILRNNNISYEREKKFDNCYDKSFLPFDFYVNNQYLIEYDGKQHYKNEGLFDYETTHKHDLIKSQWCKDNNIPLIRIPYTRYKELCIEDLLLETSNYIEK